MASTQQLTATVTLSDGSESNVTEDATWTSNDETVATVTAAGVVEAVAVGSTTVKAAYQGVENTCAVTVTNPAEGLAVTPSTAALDLGE